MRTISRSPILIEYLASPP